MFNDTYRNLTNDPAPPFDRFNSLLISRFPPGQLHDSVDDPFPIANPGRLSLRRFLRTQGTPHPSVRTLVIQANVGNLRALMNTERGASIL